MLLARTAPLRGGVRTLARGAYGRKRARRPSAPVAEAAELSWGSAVFLAVGAGTTLGAAGALGWVATASADEGACDPAPTCGCAARVAVFDTISGDYDATVGRDEWYMGLPLLRRWLLRSARGSVLEVAAGTGSNFGYYPAAVRDVTATDASRRMVDAALLKAARDARITVTRAPVEAPPGGPYDTVVDTFGLCSYDDPVEALRSLQRATRADGKVLLLEHGRSHYGWLNALLDRYAARHLERWGCSWNRDYVDVMAAAGLRVVTPRRFHFGTTYFVVGTPDPALAAHPPPSSS